MHAISLRDVLGNKADDNVTPASTDFVVLPVNSAETKP